MGKKGARGSQGASDDEGLRQRRGEAKAQAKGKAKAEPKAEAKAKDRAEPLQADGSAQEEDHSNLEGEYLNLAVLLLLYFLQGLPMGLSAVLPMVMKDRGVSFTDVGTFSLNSWPFSLKLFWAPLVDTVYVASVGRRKTWMVPAQLLIGVVMLGMSTCVDSLLYTDKPAIYTLTGLFFLLYFLCATQDIAVDGWALTMLRPENVGWAASANAFGQTAGYAAGFSGYVMLEELGVVTLSSFMMYLGVLFLVVTVLVALFISETPIPPEDEPESIADSYHQMWKMLLLRPVRIMVVVLATWKMAFPITDAIAPLKMQELGVTKAHMTYMSTLLMPILMIIPMVATRWTTGKAPLDVAMRVYPLRVACVPISALLVYCTPAVMHPIPYGFYSLVMLFSAVGAVCTEVIFVAQMAFFARISDPALGGTYMTLLNTLGNLGGKWPPTVAFYLVDALTCKTADCGMQRDGFYVVAAVCTLIGVAWYLTAAPLVHRMQRWSLDDWKAR